MPAKKECPSCAMEVDASSKVCPICSFEFPSPVKLQWIAVVLLVIFVGILIYGLI